MPEIRVPLGPPRAVCFQREPSTPKAALQPLSQHSSLLSFDSFWVVLIISCSETCDKNLAERQEENLPFDERTCHCAPGTSKLSQFLFLIISSPPPPQKKI